MASTNISYIVRKQEFTITVNGLMPLTTHYFYFESKKQAATKIKPFGKDLGAALVTDSNGLLKFTYFFDGDVPDTATLYDNYLKSSMLKAGMKSYTITNYDFGDDLPTDYQSRCRSFATNTLEIVFDAENTTTYVNTYQGSEEHSSQV